MLPLDEVGALDLRPKDTEGYQSTPENTVARVALKWTLASECHRAESCHDARANPAPVKLALLVQSVTVN